MKKVVLDTNVLVAAGFNKRSSSAEIVNLIREGRLMLAWDKPTLKETKLIIDKIPPLRWDNFKKLYEKSHEYLGVTHPEDFEIVEDRDDRKFAALAKETQATLVSNDDHLLSVRDQLGVRVQKPSELMSGLK